MKIPALEGSAPSVDASISDQTTPPPCLRLCGWPLLLAGLGLAAAAFFCDSVVDHWFASHSLKGWRQVATWVSRCGDWPGLMIGGGVAFVASWATRKPRTRHLVLTMMLAASIAGLAANGLRAITGRTRPNAGEVQGWHVLGTGGHWEGFNHKYNSFPSAHTTTAMGFVAPVLLLAAYRPRFRWLIVPSLAIPILVGWSRLYLGVHHFSDVIVAMLFGLACGLWVARAGPWPDYYRKPD